MYDDLGVVQIAGVRVVAERSDGPGATVDEVQKGSSAEASQARQTLRGGSGSGRKTTIVFFLGGVTFAEVAALRFMGEQLGEKKKIVIVTTGMLSGDAAVEAAMEKRAWGRN